MNDTYSCERITYQLLAQTQRGKLLRWGELRTTKQFLSFSKKGS
jgi:hypothetical protein